ncbi:MAG: phenylacetate--CoA ligase [Spirochaetae bacterium HGW-Spirochaetae-1]|jgi:phenylacetate-CoA ligase|nr:MAG: phenylacetate--CoA ligase [Spirochaetae bacterium HGW-Spirochaetae-1]
MIHNEKFEKMPRRELEQLQTERLQSTLNRVYRNVEFYRKKFDECKIDIEKITAIDDIKNLPFTTKEDLRNSYPYGMFAVPLRDIVRIHSSSGRTGKPIAIGYTRNDLKNWSEIVARLLVAVGITEQDFLQIAFDYSMFTGAFGIHYGAESLGASVIPSSSTRKIGDQIMIMRDYKTSALLSTPSYAIDIANNLKEMNIHPEELNLRLGIFGAEAWSEKIRAGIEEKLHISAFNHYGINELVGPGTSGECREKNGLHINEDHFIVEVIDPHTLQPVSPGGEGELVFTTITREGFPLIRYRTGDLSSLIDGPCACGRTFVRMNRVAARTDDLIVIKGINVFPAQIEEVLLRSEGVAPHFQIIIENEDGIDTMEILIEVSDSLFNDEIKRLMEMKSRMSKMLLADIGIAARITLVEQETFRKTSGGKPYVVIDRR